MTLLLRYFLFPSSGLNVKKKSEKSVETRPTPASKGCQRSTRGRRGTGQVGDGTSSLNATKGHPISGLRIGLFVPEGVWKVGR